MDAQEDGRRLRMEDGVRSASWQVARMGWLLLLAAPARSGETFSLISRETGKGEELLLGRVRGTSLIQHSCLCEDGTLMIALWLEESNLPVTAQHLSEALWVRT